MYRAWSGFRNVVAIAVATHPRGTVRHVSISLVSTKADYLLCEG